MNEEKELSIHPAFIHKLFQSNQIIDTGKFFFIEFQLIHHHFGASSEIMDVSNNHQWVLKP